MTSASLYTSLLKLGSTIVCTSVNCANSPMVTNAVALSTEMKVAKASASLCLLLPVRPFTSTPSWSCCHIYHFVLRKALKTTCSCAVSQTARLTSSSVERWPARSTPPTALFCSCCAFLDDWWTPTTRSLHKEPTTLTDACDCDGSSSFSPTCQRKSVLFHMKLLVKTLRASTSSSTWLPDHL